MSSKLAFIFWIILSSLNLLCFPLIFFLVFLILPNFLFSFLILKIICFIIFFGICGISLQPVFVYHYINLNENNNNKEYYENIIKEKDKIIIELKEKIKLLETQINNKNDDKINNNLNDYNISLKNPIHTLNYHTGRIFFLSVLNDGRLISSSYDSSIIIYNKTTYKPDLIIKEHKKAVWYITH